MSLNGVNVLVAGGCGLIGYELVLQILDCGANVIVGDCNQDFRLIDNLLATKSCYTQLDIANTGCIDQAFAVSVKQFGSVNACVNATYPLTANWGTPFEKLEMEDIQENLQLQLGGAILLSQRMMKHFVS